MFVRETPGSRSLERGLLIFRAFRPGNNALTNADLAQRTGLARSTVSRLTRTLVDNGFLEFDVATSTYQLGPPFLTFGQSVRQCSVVLSTALPLMRDLAEGLTINVGLAVPDAGEMIYLESIRKSRLGIFSHLSSGSRMAVAEASLGHAWLYGLGEAARRDALADIAGRYGNAWPARLRVIRNSFAQFEQRGFCAVAWSNGLVSVAAPLVVPGIRIHALNVSYPITSEQSKMEAKYGQLLLGARDKLCELLKSR